MRSATISIPSSLLRLTVDPIAVYMEALRAMEEQDNQIYISNVGLMVIADTIGFTSDHLTAARKKFAVATEELAGSAATYLDEVCEVLNPAGKAHSVIANALRAATDQKALTEGQRQIWADPKFFSAEILVQFIIELASIKFKIGDQTYTGAEILGSQFSSIGIAEAQTWVTLIATAAEGKLDINSANAIVKALNRETANPEDLPADALEAAQRFQETFGTRKAFAVGTGKTPPEATATTRSVSPADRRRELNEKGRTEVPRG